MPFTCLDKLRPKRQANQVTLVNSNKFNIACVARESLMALVDILDHVGLALKLRR